MDPKDNPASPVPPAYDPPESSSNGLMPIESVHPNVPVANMQPAQPGPQKMEPVYYVGHPNVGPVYPMPETQTVYPIKMEGAYPAPTDGPILGAGPPPKKGFNVPLRWLIVMIVFLVIAVIVAIVVPVVLTVNRNNSNVDVPDYPGYTPPSNGGYTPTVPSPTPRPGGGFTPQLGYNTLIVSYITTSGDYDLCYRQWLKVPYTYTIYPSISQIGSTYSAFWSVSGYSPYLYSTARDYTATPITTGGVTKWRWIEFLTFDYGTCDMGGTDYLDIGEDGYATYLQYLSVVTSSCTISSTRFYSADACYVTFRGYWS